MFVKICGTTSEEDALLAVAMGADAVGFVLAPSPRQVKTTVVADIIKRLPPEILTVGVFRNQSAQRVIEIVMATGLRGVQLHGSETPQDVAYIKSKLPLVVIKAIATTNTDLGRIDRYKSDLVLLDAPSPGSGQVFDWRLTEGVPDGIRTILAGGLNPDNVSDAIDAVHPWGVDVVSGVEASPGLKDPRKVRDFIKRAKETSVAANRNSDQGPYDWQNDR